MGKRAIVIIISLMSAFILMSGGYGFWRKPLIITGNIEVLERPLQPIVVVAPLNPVMLDPNQTGTVNPDGTVNIEVPNNAGSTVSPKTPNGLEGNPGTEPAIEPAPIDNQQPSNTQENEFPLDTENQEQTIKGVPTESASVEADRPSEDQESITENVEQGSDATTVN